MREKSLEISVDWKEILKEEEICGVCRYISFIVQRRYTLQNEKTVRRSCPLCCAIYANVGISCSAIVIIRPFCKCVCC